MFKKIIFYLVALFILPTVCSYAQEQMQRHINPKFFSGKTCDYKGIWLKPEVKDSIYESSAIMKIFEDLKWPPTGEQIIYSEEKIDEYKIERNSSRIDDLSRAVLVYIFKKILVI